MVIRDYQEQDAKALAEIYYNTIHKINIKDYTQEQVNAWALRSSLDDLTGWLEKWSKLKPMVAVVNDTIVGFAEFNDNGYIDCFYCHHEWQRHGVGSALMGAIEDRAKAYNVKCIFANVSITARPFFETKGFQMVKEQEVEFRGVKFRNNVMEKILS